MTSQATQATCPICSAPLSLYQEQANGTVFDCPRCGKAYVSGFGKWGVDDMQRRLGNSDALSLAMRSRLSHCIRRQNDRSGSRPFQVPLGDDWDSLQLDQPLPSVAEQADNLILWTGKNQPAPEQWAKDNIYALSARVGVLIDPQTPGASSGLMWIVTNLEKQGLLSFKPPPMAQKMYNASGHSIPLPEISLQLTFQGWTRYGELMRGQTDSQTAFMAMKFDPDVESVVKGYFKPAVAKTGFELRMLTDNQPAGLIDDQLRVALRRSKFIIADLTHGNQGAYWEAGFAEGLGRPVIYTCRKQEWEQNRTHFDTNHLVTIIWDPDDLTGAAKKLTDTIRATLPAEARATDD